MLRDATVLPPWLGKALLWNDEKDGRPDTPAAIAAALATLEIRLGIGAGLRDNAKAFNFTTRFADAQNVNFTLFTNACDRSIEIHVLGELSGDPYEVGSHRLDGEGDVALDIGGHVGAAALQLASRATGTGSGVISWEPTSQNYFFAQWNAWVNGFHQDKLVVLHAGVSDVEKDACILYSPVDTTGAGSWRTRYPHQRFAYGRCDLKKPSLVRMMGFEAGLRDLGILGPGSSFAPRKGRRIRFVKLVRGKARPSFTTLVPKLTLTRLYCLTRIAKAANIPS